MTSPRWQDYWAAVLPGGTPAGPFVLHGVKSYIAEAGGASMFAPMNMSSLDSLMSPVADCLDRPSLEALVSLRASPDAARVMQSLAERANEGLLTAEERSEYESCILFTNFLGILQSKARRRLAAGV